MNKIEELKEYYKLDNNISIDELIYFLIKRCCNSYNLLGCGATRAVFKVPLDMVLKVPIPLAEFLEENQDLSTSDIHDLYDDGTAANETEFLSYKKVLKDGAANLVAKIYCAASDFSGLLAERCEILSDDEEYDEAFDKFIEFWDNYFFDLHMDNIGINSQGQYVCIDLGEGVGDFKLC